MQASNRIKNFVVGGLAVLAGVLSFTAVIFAGPVTGPGCLPGSTNPTLNSPNNTIDGAGWGVCSRRKAQKIIVRVMMLRYGSISASRDSGTLAGREVKLTFRNTRVTRPAVPIQVKCKPGWYETRTDLIIFDRGEVAIYTEGFYSQRIQIKKCPGG